MSAVYYGSMIRVRRAATGLVRSIAAAALLSVAACARPAEPPPPARVNIWTNAVGGSYQLLGEAIARVFAARLPDVAVTVVPSGGSTDNVDAMMRGEADVAIALGDVAYLAYREDSEAHDAPDAHLRGIAVLYRSAVHFVVPRTSRVRRVSDLTRGRIGVLTGMLALQRQRTTQVLLEAHGLEPSSFEIQPLTLEQVRAGFRDGSLQAGVFAALPPNPLFAEDAADMVVIPLDPAAVERARERYPFFQSMTIPAGTHPNQPEPIESVGIDNLLVCREDLDPELVYRLTKTFIESLPEIARDFTMVRLPGPDLASATPIPLHPGAARYYRERELLLY